MSVFLARSLLLSSAISIFITGYFFFNIQSKEEAKKKNPVKIPNNYSASLSVLASRSAFTSNDEAFKKAVGKILLSPVKGCQLLGSAIQ